MNHLVSVGLVKKQDSSTRFCVNYSQLKNVTTPKYLMEGGKVTKNAEPGPDSRPKIYKRAETQERADRLSVRQLVSATLSVTV